MARYQIKNKLSKREQGELFIKLAKSVALLRNPQEVAEFLKDLLSEDEVLMLARRLQIAELLIDGLTYQEISSRLKVGAGTIARIQTWLELYGDGYRTVVKRVGRQKDQEQKADPMEPFAQLKRKYPMYFWPELLLEEIIRSANRREKQRLAKTIEQLRDKTKLSKELDRLLN